MKYMILYVPYSGSSYEEGGKANGVSNAYRYIQVNSIFDNLQDAEEKLKELNAPPHSFVSALIYIEGTYKLMEWE